MPLSLKVEDSHVQYGRGNFLKSHNSNQIMKKIILSLFSIVFSLLITIPVLAVSHGDPKCFVLYEKTTSSGYDRICSLERASTSLRSVFITETNSGRIIDGEKIKFHIGVSNKEYYPSAELQEYTLGTDSTFNKYDLYTWTSSDLTFSKNDTNIVMYFDYVFETKADYYAELARYDSYEDFIKKADVDFGLSGSTDENKLPMLHYKMSSKNVVSFPNIIDKKISIDWDFSSIEPYASDPMNYAIEILISANFYPNSEGKRICWDASNTAINPNAKGALSSDRSLLEKPFTFKYFEKGDALYSASNHIFATDELQDGYYLYIRSYSKDGTKSSNYKVYKCTTGGTSGQMDLTYDTEGNEHPLEDEDRDENGDYSNEYDSDSSSSADTDPSGDYYKGNGGYSFDTLYGNLNSMVNMLQGVPELWMHVMSWLPSWFPTFIVTMMGLLIVIGVLKYIL